MDQSVSVTLMLQVAEMSRLVYSLTQQNNANYLVDLGIQCRMPNFLVDRVDLGSECHVLLWTQVQNATFNCGPRFRMPRFIADLGSECPVLLQTQVQNAPFYCRPRFRMPRLIVDLGVECHVFFKTQEKCSSSLINFLPY